MLVAGGVVSVAPLVERMLVEELTASRNPAINAMTLLRASPSSAPSPFAVIVVVTRPSL